MSSSISAKGDKSKDDKIKSLERKIEKLETGTQKRFKDVADIQAAIGRNAVVFQKVRAYIIAFILFLCGLGLLIWNAVYIKATDNYIIAGIFLFIALMIVVITNVYTGFVKQNKNVAIYNAFALESEMLAGNRGRGRRNW